MQTSELARQAVRPGGDRARPQAYDHVTWPGQLLYERGEMLRAIEGVDVAMTAFGQTADDSLPSDPLDGSSPAA